MWSLRPKCQRLRFTQKSFKSFKSFQSALEGDVSFVERAEVTEIGYALFAACMVLIIFMIIRNHSTKETATRSSLHNRGYERSEHPRQVETHAIVHSGGVLQPQKGNPFRVDADAVWHPGALCTPRLLSGDAFSVLLVQLRIIIS